MAVVVVLAATTASCASVGWSAVSEAPSLSEAETAPAVISVIGLGSIDLPIEGALQADKGTDAKAIIGETLWIQGTNFGREPTVQIGGQDAPVSTRTANGGILLRVPPGTPSGVQPLVVANQHGRAEKTVTIKRRAAALPPRPGTVAWAEITSDGPTAINFTNVPEARLLRIGHDGRAAYVVAGPGVVLTTFDMTTRPQPTLVHKTDLGPAPARALFAAASAPVVGIVRDQDLILFDTTSPLRPARKDPLPLPPALRAAHPRRSQVSPDGKLLAFLAGDKNQIILVELAALGPAGDKAVVATLLLEPTVAAPILNNLAFSADGKTLWVVAGDNAESQVAGPQATRVYAVRVSRQKDATIKLRLLRTVTLAGATNPVHITTGRGLSPAAENRNRLPPEKQTVYVTATTRQGARTVVYAVGIDNNPGEIIVTEGKDRTGSAEVTPDGRWLVAATLDDEASFRLSCAAADGSAGARTSVVLVEGPDRVTVVPPGSTGEIHMQP